MRISGDDKNHVHPVNAPEAFPSAQPYTRHRSHRMMKHPGGWDEHPHRYELKPRVSPAEVTTSLKLLVQPDDGIAPLLEAMRSAKKSIQILVFRIDRPEIERALVDAVERGVCVTALIAYTNRGGDKSLRRFEMRLLEKGITVARTADDLVRYHGKMFIIDERELFLLAFNYTHLDITLSRSFALQVRKKELVEEAIKLFRADVQRLPYKPGHSDFVVSPLNARQALMSFIAGAKKQLLLYEMKISDRDFVDLLNKKVSEGVDVRVIGQASRKGSPLATRKLAMRLHTRAILRDGTDAFLGSQSLRKLELEARREIGIIVRDRKITQQMVDVFDKDWKSAEPVTALVNASTILDGPAKKVAKSVARQLNIGAAVENVLDKVLDSKGELTIESKEVTQTVREAVREEVQEAVMSALQTMVDDGRLLAHSALTEEAKSKSKAG